MLASQSIDKHSAADDDDDDHSIDKHGHGVVPPVATATVLGLSAPPLTPTRLCDDWRLADALQHLVDVYPESVSVSSRTTNQTPLKLIARERIVFRRGLPSSFQVVVLSTMSSIADVAVWIVVTFPSPGSAVAPHAMGSSGITRRSYCPCLLLCMA